MKFRNYFANGLTSLALAASLVACDNDNTLPKQDNNPLQNKLERYEFVQEQFSNGNYGISYNEGRKLLNDLSQLERDSTKTLVDFTDTHKVQDLKDKVRIIIAQSDQAMKDFQ